MDLFLSRTRNGTFEVPASASEVRQSEPLKAQSPQELTEEVSSLTQRQVGMVSVRRQQVLRLGLENLKSTLAANEIQVGSVGYAGGFTGSLGRSYEAAVVDTLRTLELAAELQAQSVVILPGCRGRHTYNHASKTILTGLERCLDDALRYRINMQVALNTVLGGSKDVFCADKQLALDWIQDMESHRIRALMVVRGPESWDGLPDCWQRCLRTGGIVRLSRRCREIEGTTRVIERVVQQLNRPLPARQKLAVASMHR